MTEETAAPYTRKDAEKDLVKWKVYNSAYHNDAAIVPDAVFDKLTKKLLPFYPSLKKAFGAEPVAKHASQRMERPDYPMSSLDKVFYGENEFNRSHKSKLSSALETLIAEKVDGASMQLVCDTKGVRKLYSRGSNKNGLAQNVSHLIPYLDEYGILGKIAKGEAIRFELVIPHGNKSLDNDDAKKRNAVSGIINARTPNLKLLAKCWAIALAYMAPAQAPSRMYKKLKTNGWRIPKHLVWKTIDVTENSLQALHNSWKDKAKFQIDGLVVLANVVEAPKLTNPKRGFAFKVNDEGQQTTVKEVRWQVSRYKAMTPVCIIEPVDVDSVKVSKATAHNAKFVKDFKIGPGAVVSIIRSGGVIPKIDEVISGAAKASFPKAGTYEWNESKVEIYTVDEQHDATANARQLQIFFRQNGVLGMGPKVAALVADLDIHQVISLTTGGWAARGVGSANSDKMPTQIKTALKNTSVPRIMAFSGVFGEGFGLSSAEDLWSVVQEYKPKTKRELAERLADLVGWTPKSAKETAARWPEWVKFFNAMPYKPSTKKAAVVDGPLKGAVVVFTKVRDPMLQEAIQKAGGLIADNVTKATTHVIRMDGQDSTKTAAAEKNGAKIIDYSKARKVLKL